LTAGSLLLGARGAAVAAAAKKPAGILLEKYAITSDRLEGVLGGPGPGEWSGNVTVSGEGGKATCDRLRVWLAADGRYIERAEAGGHLVVQGRYVADDGTEWQIVGKAESAVYERKSGQATLTGSVHFEATNLGTGVVLSIDADKLVYDTSTRRFRFEGVQRQVRGRWQEPPGEAAPAAGAPQAADEQAESEP
jgi:lipopolysaccharide export system protein LptA